MARPFEGLILNEGYTDLGPLEFEINSFEEEIQILDPGHVSPIKPELNTRSFLIRLGDSGNFIPLPQNYKVVFTISDVPTELEVVNESAVNIDGYIDAIIPLFPVAILSGTETSINITVEGPLSVRSEECYIELSDGAGTLYTLIKDLIVHDGEICVTDGDTLFYPLADTITVGEDIIALYFTPAGKVYGFDDVTGDWSLLGTLKFTQISNPSALEPTTDGFYESAPGAEPITTGIELGTVSSAFELHTLTLLNPQPFKVDVEIEVYTPTGVTPIASPSYDDLDPESRSLITIYIDEEIEAEVDETPTLSDLVALGHSFSELKTFLEDPARDLDTILKIRKAGPIAFIDDMPEEMDPAQIAIVQAHVDLYGLNPDIIENKYIISKGFGDIDKISSTPKDVFLTEVVDETGPALYNGARIHEISVQVSKLTNVLTAGALTGLSLENSPTPDLEGSSFLRNELQPPKCGCDDCQSMVSPFAYLMDLLKYGAKYLKHTPSYNPGGTAASLSAVLATKFYQPFGDLNVDCKTLHEEFCRVRLVAEVLEQRVAALTLSAAKQTKLLADRKKYLLTAYMNLLLQAGTSFDELRNIISLQPPADRNAAALKLTQRLGIMLVDIATSEYTVDIMWLTFTGTGSQELTQANLEAVFGLRDSERSVLTSTPKSLIELWKEQYLDQVWGNEDYFFSEFTREDINLSDPFSFKSNWQPIVDPDIIGLDDFTPVSSPFALRLWKHRKIRTDEFVEYYKNDATNILTEVSIDNLSRAIEILGRDIADHVIENNEVLFDNGVSYDPFNINSRVLQETGTLVYFDKSTVAVPQIALFEPVGTVVRYLRMVKVTSIVTGANSATLSWTPPTILDYVVPSATVFMALRSDDLIATDPVYDIGGTSSDNITSVVFTSATAITLNLTGNLSADFLNGNIELVFTVEVPLRAISIPDPEKVVNELFSKSEVYDILDDSPFLNHASLADVTATVWNNAGNFTVFGGATDFQKIKSFYARFLSDNLTTSDKSLVEGALHLDFEKFDRGMRLLLASEEFLQGMHTNKMPTENEIAELASILRFAGRKKLRAAWVKEEMAQLDAPSGSPRFLMLDGAYFWKALSEPNENLWDAALQTVPATTGAITSSDIPIIDPEHISRNQISDHFSARIYLDLYDVRVAELKDKYNDYVDLLVPHQNDGFVQILNEINTGSTVSPFSAGSYGNDLNALLLDLKGTNPLISKQAGDESWAAFGISGADLLKIEPLLTLYEATNPLLHPSDVSIVKLVPYFVSGFKHIQLYPTWVLEEVGGGTTLTSGWPVSYFETLKSQLPLGRASFDLRSSWQKTLAAWNKKAIIDPDILAPENIKNFVPGDTIRQYWVDRKVAIDGDVTDIKTYFIDPAMSLSDLKDNIEDLIDIAFSRVKTFTINPTTPYLPDFEKLAELEDAGQSILPFLEQRGFTVAEYRKLKHALKVLSYPAALLDSEYEEIVSIFIKNRSRNFSFVWIQEEFSDQIILSSDAFMLYTPSAISFPINVVPVYDSFRSPQKERKEWLQTLSSRIDREKNIIEQWKESLMWVEEKTMPVLRDALILALSNDCESMDNAAERLAKSFLIETKDNCCFKHTRVSFAIETLQGLFFALSTGIYDSSLSAWKLSSTFFKDNWRWLGSYASWRAAVFTTLFPENILYPGLKRLQSPKFKELMEKIQNANRLSPEQACGIGKEYQTYFEDIQNLKIICSTNAQGYIFPVSTNSCCDSSLSLEKQTFFFGQGITGKAYWNVRINSLNPQQALGFWEEIPSTKGKSVKLVGCFVLYDSNDSLIYRQTRPNLWLFYTFLDNGRLILAYVKKDLFSASNAWSDEKQTEDMPQYSDAIDSFPSEVTACQHSAPDIEPIFILTYPETNFVTNNYTESRVLAKFNKDSNSVQLAKAKSTPTATSTLMNRESLMLGLITGVRFTIFGTTAGTGLWGVIAFVGKDKCEFYPYSTDKYIQAPPVWTPPQGRTITGAFESRSETNTIVVLSVDINGTTYVDRLVLSFSDTSYTVSITLTSIGSTGITSGFSVSTIEQLAPIFAYSRDTNHIFAGKIRGSTSIACNVYTSSTIMGLYKISRLSPEKLPAPVSIESAECTPIMLQRKSNIKLHFDNNSTFTPGSNAQDFSYGECIKEYLREAYYFFPMVLALDQQRRGEFQSALAWYSSIYDYTNNAAANRKIYHGLILEESPANLTAALAPWWEDPLNPHGVAGTRVNSYTKYTLINIVQCLYSWADREFTIDTIESLPVARKLYTEALELLNSVELRQSNNCTGFIRCFRSATYLPDDFNTWAGLAKKLVDSLEEIGDAAIMESIGEQITTIMNDTGPSYESKFTDSFELIAEAMAEIESSSTPETVSEGLTSGSERSNNAGRYLAATQELGSFYSYIGQRYTSALATLIDVDEDSVSLPETESRIEWLNTPTPENGSSLKFEFTDDSGDQNFGGENAYSAIGPTGTSISTNIAFSNPHIFIVYQSGGTPLYEYVPLINDKFCAPANPIFSSLTMKGNVEMYKILNCRNIAGMVREVEAYAAATDSTTGIPIIGASGNLVLPGLKSFTPSQYRYRVLIERTKQIVAQAQQLESLFLASLEKLDEANFNLLKAQQSLTSSNATIKLQDLRIGQARSEQQLASMQLEKTIFSKNNYDDWIATGLNEYEQKSLKNLENAMSLSTASAIAGAGGAALASDWRNPSIAILNVLNGGLRDAASAFSTQSSIFSQMASYERRSQEWEFQSALAAFDVNIGNQQIKIADDNIRVLGQEKRIAELGSEQARDTLEFLKNKFTNAALYNWMSNVLERSYSYLLNLATSLAKTAESQLYFERQEQAGPFILDDYWQVASTSSGGSATDRRGLTGSARLLVDVTRLDQYAFETQKRKLQMTKVISLAALFPGEFQRFRETGVMNFELTNNLFDYDFPGHYLRLINGVKSSVIGLIPVYDGIKATLTAASTSYTVIGGTTFQKIPIKRLDVESVALTSAMNATGLFEMQPVQGDMLNPFEGMGIESRWEFKMPQFSNRFDFSQIADVLITVEYTALDSFLYKAQVLQSLSTDYFFSRAFSFKNDFPDSWYQLSDALSSTEPFFADVKIRKSQFPQGISNVRLSGEIVVYFIRDVEAVQDITGVDLIKSPSSVGNNKLEVPASLTLDGFLPTTGLMNTLGSNSGLDLDLRVIFDNTPENLDLFAAGKVKDILMVFKCRGELKPYPL